MNIDSPQYRIRQVVNATRAVHGMAVRHDATPQTADCLASLCAAMMRTTPSRHGLNGASAYMTCARIMRAALGCHRVSTMNGLQEAA